MPTCWWSTWCQDGRRKKGISSSSYSVPWNMRGAPSPLKVLLITIWCYIPPPPFCLFHLRTLRRAQVFYLLPASEWKNAPNVFLLHKDFWKMINTQKWGIFSSFFAFLLTKENAPRLKKCHFFPLQLRIVMGTNPDSISIRLDSRPFLADSIRLD